MAAHSSIAGFQLAVTGRSRRWLQEIWSIRVRSRRMYISCDHGSIDDGVIQIIPIAGAPRRKSELPSYGLPVKYVAPERFGQSIPDGIDVPGNQTPFARPVCVAINEVIVAVAIEVFEQRVR